MRTKIPTITFDREEQRLKHPELGKIPQHIWNNKELFEKKIWAYFLPLLVMDRAECLDTLKGFVASNRLSQSEIRALLLALFYCRPDLKKEEHLRSMASTIRLRGSKLVTTMFALNDIEGLDQFKNNYPIEWIEILTKPRTRKLILTIIGESGNLDLLQKVEWPGSAGEEDEEEDALTFEDYVSLFDGASRYSRLEIILHIKRNNESTFRQLIPRDNFAVFRHAFANGNLVFYLMFLRPMYQNPNYKNLLEFEEMLKTGVAFSIGSLASQNQLDMLDSINDQLGNLWLAKIICAEGNSFSAIHQNIKSGFLMGAMYLINHCMRYRISIPEKHLLAESLYILAAKQGATHVLGWLVESGLTTNETLLNDESFFRAYAIAAINNHVSVLEQIEAVFFKTYGKDGHFFPLRRGASTSYANVTSRLGMLINDIPEHSLAYPGRLLSPPNKTLLEEIVSRKNREVVQHWCSLIPGLKEDFEGDPKIKALLSPNNALEEKSAAPKQAAAASSSVDRSCSSIPFYKPANTQDRPEGLASKEEVVTMHTTSTTLGYSSKEAE